MEHRNGAEHRGMSRNVVERLSSDHSSPPWRHPVTLPHTWRSNHWQLLLIDALLANAWPSILSMNQFLPMYWCGICRGAAIFVCVCPHCAPFKESNDIVQMPRRRPLQFVRSLWAVLGCRPHVFTLRIQSQNSLRCRIKVWRKLVERYGMSAAQKRNCVCLLLMLWLKLPLKVDESLWILGSTWG